MNSQTATLCHSSDQVFEQLIEEVTARLQTGEAIDLSEISSKHPEYSDRLRQLLPSMQALLAFGVSQSAASDDPTTGATNPPIIRELGDFRIVREIGRGGMGVVYEAEQISIGRRVALKVLPFAAMLDERRLARFRNEIRAAGQLHHTHIVPVHAVGSDRGVHFYAMQLVVGHSLAEIIAELRNAISRSRDPQVVDESQDATAAARETIGAALSTLPEINGIAYFRRLAQLALQAVDALEHAHGCGIIHRDVKPSNLLVDTGGTIWLTDFGLASTEASSDLTMTGELLGTLRYMSPEQTLGQRVFVDHRTDIYSLGATLYELLTLKPAFDAASRTELLRQISQNEPVLPRWLNPAIPVDLETIVLKAMSKDVAGRYSSARAMADDLRRFLEHRPIAARRPTIAERTRKWAGRHSSAVATAAGSLALIATAGAVATFVSMRAYRAELQQRTAAEDNLEVAAQIIDRMLSRAADENYYAGDLAQAEKLAADASEFYEQLLERNDDVELRIRAAAAHGEVAHIWQLVGRHEKAAIANRKAGELLLQLTTAVPGEQKYLVALAENYNSRGLIDWSLDRPSAAEPSFRQAWEIYAELSEQHPDEPNYQRGVSSMLANLGCVCYFSDRFDEAEEYYRRSEAISEHLPSNLRNSAEGLASQAGSITNQAELARLRGQYDRALELLQAAIPLHKQSLEKWPTNPVALDCYWYTCWNIGECQLGAKRATEAAAAAEQLVATFPDRLDAYHQAAAQLVRCSVLTESSDLYLGRAGELIAVADTATKRTPQMLERFAWFLLTSEEKSLRDPRRGLALAKEAIEAAPERSEAWFALALAQYRNGQWQAAETGVQKSINLSSTGQADVYDWLLLGMIRWQEGRSDDARRHCDRAHDWLEAHDVTDPDLFRLAKEVQDLDPRFQFSPQ